MTASRPTPAWSSPLLGLWLVFVAAAAGCAQGVRAHEISWAAASLSLLLLVLVIRLTASALRVPAHPIPLARLADALWALRGVLTRLPIAAGR